MTQAIYILKFNRVTVTQRTGNIFNSTLLELISLYIIRTSVCLFARHEEYGEKERERESTCIIDLIPDYYI